MDKVPAIILSAHTMALGVVRALGVKGVPVAVVHYDARDIAHLSRYVMSSFAAPHPEESPEEFLELLLRLPKCWHGGVIFPVSDESLMFTARHKEALSRLFRVACPDFQTVKNVIDKQWTYPIAEKAGVSVPDSRIFHTCEELEDKRSEIVLPCLVKPSQSHLYYARFGVKMRLAESWEQLHDYFIQANHVGLDVIVQEFIPGLDDTVYNYNAFVVEGEPLVEFTAAHVRNAPPTFGSPRVALSEQCPELLEDGRKLMRALNFSGFACNEFKRDQRDGRFKLMEVNGRHNLSTLLSVKCGINFPWIEYAYRAHGELPSSCAFESGVYWIDLTRDLAYSIRYARTERYSLKQYLRPYCQPKAWAILDRRDVRPMLQRVINLAFGGAISSFMKRTSHNTESRKLLSRNEGAKVETTPAG